MTSLSLRINGEAHQIDIEPRTTLADVVREKLNLTGTHISCEHGVCGACTVMMDNRPVRSCITFAIQSEGHDVRTIEGFDNDPIMDILREAFTREHGVQCGFCTPGMLITARDIVTRLGDPGEQRVRQELAGNLCRCTGYVGIVKAIRSVGATKPVDPGITKRPAAAPLPAVKRAKGDPRKLVRKPNAAAALAPATVTQDTANGISQEFVLDAGIESAWTFFRDLPSVARCVPGAELIRFDDKTFEGRISVKLGPIQASVDGQGNYQFEDATHTISVVGKGLDRISRSTVQGALKIQLESINAASTRGHVSLSFDLQGMLAHFSRSAIVREFTARIVSDFARRASASILGEQPAIEKNNALGITSIIRFGLQAFWSFLFKRRDK